MALTLEAGAISRWRGLSTDQKFGEPGISDSQDIRPGSIITETDTGDRYVWRGSWPWVLQETSMALLFAELMELNEKILWTQKLIQRNTATIANAMAQTGYPTDVE